jgi:hypothetical protein
MHMNTPDLVKTIEALNELLHEERHSPDRAHSGSALKDAVDILKRLAPAEVPTILERPIDAEYLRAVEARKRELQMKRDRAKENAELREATRPKDAERND